VTGPDNPRHEQSSPEKFSQETPLMVRSDRPVLLWELETVSGIKANRHQPLKGITCDQKHRGTPRAVPVDSFLTQAHSLPDLPTLTGMKIKEISDALYRRWLKHHKPSAKEYNGVDAGGYYFLLDKISGGRVFVSGSRRLGHYTKGVRARVDNPTREYCLNDLV
jgi:hypothetical protein